MNAILDRHTKEIEILQNSLKKIQQRNDNLEGELKIRVSSLQPEESNSFSLVPECPYCFEEFRPPLNIFNCGNGHLVCSNCRPKLDRDYCHCGGPFLGRATAMEHLVRKIVESE